MSAQIARESVNMVTGTGWPGGDPYLQRQNGPSIAVSSANPEHLLAGANDYRTVQLPRVGGGVIRLTWNGAIYLFGGAWSDGSQGLSGEMYFPTP